MKKHRQKDKDLHHFNTLRYCIRNIVSEI